MNSSPDFDHECTLSSPSDRQITTESHINNQLGLLRDQINNVTDRLQVNMKILNEKQNENKQLKEMLAKLEANTGQTAPTETTFTNDSKCVYCKACEIF